MSYNLFLSNPLLFFGILYFAAFFLNFVFHRMNLPHILFYLLVGMIAGNYLFVTELHSTVLESWFHKIEIFALGLIGFEIGTELHIDELKKRPKLIGFILVGDILVTFTVVTTLVFIFTRDGLLSIMLGALSTSTAPATTVGVIKKLRAKGPMTRLVQWLLAFDDVLSVMVVEAILVLSIVTLGGHPSISDFAFRFGQEIGLAIVLGIIIGYILDAIVERMDDNLEMMEISFAVILLAVGLGEFAETSAITMTMTIGAVVTNLHGDNYKDAHELLEILMAPILALFFIQVGGKVNISNFYNPFPWLSILYLFARTSGKFGGVYSTSTLLRVKPKIKKGTSTSLFAQGGVVLGLSSIASEIFTDLGNPELGIKILSIVIISTILAEVLGAFGTDYGIKLNNEQFKDVNPFIGKKGQIGSDVEEPRIEYEYFID